MADQQLRRRVAEELEDEGAVHEAAAVVRLLGADAQAQHDALGSLRRPSRSAVPARELLEQEGGDARGRRAGAEARVVAELLGQRVVDPRAARDEDDAVAQPLGLEHVHEVGQVADVDLVLRHRRGDEDGVGLRLARPAAPTSATGTCAPRLRASKPW